MYKSIRSTREAQRLWYNIWRKVNQKSTP